MNHVMLDDLYILNEVRMTLLTIQLVNEHVIDALDDVVNFRHNSDQQMLVPLLQCFRQDGVVGVSEGLLCNLQCLLKAYAFIGSQQTNQLRNRDNRMGIIQLNGIEISKMREIIAVNLFVILDDVLQGRRAEEILLLQAKLLTFICGVIRIQYTGNILCTVLFTYRCFIMLCIEFVEIEGRNRFCLPQTQVADVLGTITDNRQVIRYSADSLVSELNQNSLGIHADAPGIAETGPVIRSLHLETVLNVLLEQAVLVADAIAIQRQLQRCSGIQEAGCQTAQAAIAQRSILYFFQICQIQAALLKHLLNFIVDAQAQQVVVNRTSNQELRRHVVRMTRSRMQLLAFFPGICNLGHDRF